MLPARIAPSVMQLCVCFACQQNVECPRDNPQCGNIQAALGPAAQQFSTPSLCGNDDNPNVWSPRNNEFLTIKLTFATAVIANR